MASAYETSLEYGQKYAAELADRMIAAGLGDRLFDIPTFKICQSTLADMLSFAFVSGMLEAQRRLSGGAE